MAETATFALRVDADASAPAEAAAELEKFRASIAKSQQALADYRKSSSLLKGSSAEVKDAKDKLKAAIEAEKGKITQANLGILKLGGSYEKLTKAQKHAKGGGDEVKKAISSIGGPAKDLSDKFEGLQTLMGAMSSGWGAVAVGLAVIVAAAVAAAAAMAALTVKFSEWLLTTADANRNLALTREAFSGSAKNATAWGHAMDWASEKLPLTTAALNDLVVATEKSYRGARISGQGMVDAFKASASAAAAGRTDVASFFDEIIGRGKLTGRTAITFPDLARFRNAGISAAEVYKELGIKAGSTGRAAVVSTDKMAAALRKLSENRFADVNAKKMLSLGSITDRLKDNFMRFTNDLAGEGGALEPLLKAFKSLADMFDLSTQSGQDLKALITSYGTAISDAFVSHLPDIKATVQSIIDIAPSFIDAGKEALNFASDTIGVFADLLGGADGLKDKMRFVADNFTEAAAAVRGIHEAFVFVENTLSHLMQMVREFFNNTDFASIGTSIVDGIKAGLTAAWNGLKNAVSTMANGIKSTFKTLLGIASPSKEFAGYGRQTAAGYGGGIDAGQPRVRAAAERMATTATSAVATTAVAATPAPRGASAGSSSTSNSQAITAHIEAHFHIPPGANAQQVREAVSSPSVLEGLQSSIKMMLQSQGLPTGMPVSSGG